MLRLSAHRRISPEPGMFLSPASHTVAIFMDGSVNQQSGKAGSTFTYNDYVYSRRISNGASTLQAELLP